MPWPIWPVAPNSAIFMCDLRGSSVKENRVILRRGGSRPLHLAFGDFCAQLQRSLLACLGIALLHRGDQRGGMLGFGCLGVVRLDVITSEAHLAQVERR